MRSRALAHAISIAVLVMEMTSGPVAADCSGRIHIAHGVRAVQGTTFVGTVRSFEYGRYPGHPRYTARVTWQVERVFAGGTLPDRIDYLTPPCLTAAVQPGVRYLFTTSDIEFPDSEDSAAWIVRPGEALDFWGFGRDLEIYADLFEPFVALETMDEALDAVAPGAGEGLPPTDSDDGALGQASAPLLMALTVLFVGTVGFAMSRPLRRRSPES